MPGMLVRRSLMLGPALVLCAAVAAGACGSNAQNAVGSGDGGSADAESFGNGLNKFGGSDGAVEASGPSVNTNYPCAGCAAFPGGSAPSCPSSTLAPPTLVYPVTGALLPPNMNVLEVQFVPPPGAKLFEVDFQNSVTTVRVETTCGPVPDVRGGTTRGCGVTLPQAAWNDIANTNRDGDAVSIVVRATDQAASCVSSSTAKVQIAFAKDDLKGGIYYWQSATYGGVGGKTGGIYSHDFGTFDPTPTPFYTSGSTGTCVGCHTLSRDGARMSLLGTIPTATMNSATSTPSSWTWRRETCSAARSCRRASRHGPTITRGSWPRRSALAR